MFLAGRAGRSGLSAWPATPSSVADEIRELVVTADAERLERIAAARGEKPESVIADLLREADRPAA